MALKDHPVDSIHSSVATSPRRPRLDVDLASVCARGSSLKGGNFCVICWPVRRPYNPDDTNRHDIKPPPHSTDVKLKLLFCKPRLPLSWLHLLNHTVEQRPLDSAPAAAAATVGELSPLNGHLPAQPPTISHESVPDKPGLEPFLSRGQLSSAQPRLRSSPAPPSLSIGPLPP